MWQHSQYYNQDICWKIWDSNLGRSKRTISSTKYPDQLQHAPTLILKKNQSFFSGSKVAGVDNLTTHIHLETSLKISAATPPQNLSASMEHSGTTLFYLKLLPTYILLKRFFLVLQRNHFTQYILLTFTLHDPFISSVLNQLH